MLAHFHNPALSTYLDVVEGAVVGSQGSSEVVAGRSLRLGERSHSLEVVVKEPAGILHCRSVVAEEGHMSCNLAAAERVYHKADIAAVEGSCRTEADLVEGGRSLPADCGKIGLGKPYDIEA